MTLHKFLLILGLLLTLIGSFYLAYGNFKSATDIVRESGTYWGGNHAVKLSSIRLGICSFVGFALLVIGIIFQISSVIIINRDFDIRINAGIILIAVVIAVLLAQFYISFERKRLIRKTSKIEIMRYKMPEGTSLKDRIDRKFGGKYDEIGKNFFLLEKDKDEANDRYIERLNKVFEEIKI